MALQVTSLGLSLLISILTLSGEMISKMLIRLSITQLLENLHQNQFHSLSSLTLYYIELRGLLRFLL